MSCCANVSSIQVDAPSRTSPQTPSSSFESHIHLFDGRNWSNPNVSSIKYPIAIEAYSWAMFRTYPFNTLFKRSTQYIHLECVGSHISSSSTRWKIRWTIMSKNEGDIIISSIHIVMAMCSFKVPILVKSSTLAHMCLKMRLRCMITILVRWSINPRTHNGSNCYMNMCQSWAFMVEFVFLETCFKGALQYSVGTCKDFKQPMNTISSSSFNTYGAVGFIHLLRTCRSWNSHKWGLIPSSFKYCRTPKVSFIPKIICTTFSQPFFPMCMTSKQCFRRNPYSIDYSTM